MIARRLLVIPLIIVGLLLSVRPSVACSCHSYTPAELAEVSEVVFTGVAQAYSTVNPVERYIVVEFHVGTVYKGPSATRIQVQAVGGRGPSGGLGPGCEYGFQLGQQYTVFAKDHDSDGVPNTNGCFRSVEGPIDAATYGLAAGHAPARNDETVLLSVVAAVAIAALGLISVALRPRRVAP